MNEDLLRIRNSLDMSQAEAAVVLGVCPATYWKLEKSTEKNIRVLNDFRDVASVYERLAEIPEIHLSQIDDGLIGVSIMDADFDVTGDQLYDYFVFRPLVLRYAHLLLPRMKHVIWRRSYLPGLLARMEK